jgi:CRISPR-associated protein Cas2
MVVLIVRTVPPGLRGELSRWMLEFQAGVFVGQVPSRVREKLWLKVISKSREGSAIMIVPARNEQGFAVRCHGDTAREPVDFDGITLMRFKRPRA